MANPPKKPLPTPDQSNLAASEIIDSVNKGAPCYADDGTPLAGKAGAIATSADYRWCFNIQGTTVQNISTWVLSQVKNARQPVQTPSGPSYVGGYDALIASHSFPSDMKAYFRDDFKAGSGGGGTTPPDVPNVSIGRTSDPNEVMRRLSLDPPVDPNGYQFATKADWDSRLKDQRANAYRNAVESQSWNDIDPNVVKFLFTSGFASDNGPGVRGTAAKTYQGPVTPEEVHGMDISAMVAYFYPETGQPSGKP